MTNCPPVYRNLQCESFGNKRKITSQMLRQMCKNDAYLYEQVMALWDSTDPESRKRFYPPDFMDVAHSFGIESYILTEEMGEYNYWKEVYRFSRTRKWIYKFDFDGSNDKLIEYDENGRRLMDGDVQYAWVYADSFLDVENSHNKQLLEIVNEDGVTTLRPQIATSSFEYIIHHDEDYTTKEGTGDKYVVKDEKLGKAKKDASFKGAFNNWHCNSHWYNGFNRTKNYNIKSKWRKDQDSYDIPSVCHAQTFKASNTGRLSKVNLNVQGTKSSVSPCIVEIRETSKTGYPTTNVLARTEKKFSGSGDNVVAFEFKNKAKVTKGKIYAIVIRSPLSHFENTFRIGGWTTGCFSSEKKYYGNGSAFTSEDNGKTWKKNGKTKDTKSYGSHYYDWGINQKPVDFAFEVFVQPITKKAIKQKVTTSNAKKLIEDGYTLQQDGKYKKILREAYDEKHTYEYSYIKEGSYYIHLKPIQVNPIDSFAISSVFTDNTTFSRYWRWEYYDSKLGWLEVPTDATGVDFNNNNTNRTVLKLRIRCDIEQNTYVDTTTTITDSALNELISKEKLSRTVLTYMKSATLVILTKYPQKAYLRTLYYHPPQNQILGANIWSEIGLNAQESMNNESAELEIDVIHEKVASEHFKFYDLNILNNADMTDLTPQQADLIRDMSLYISSYKLENISNNYSTYDAQYILDYVVEDKDNGGLFIEFLMRQVTPVYLLPLYYNESTEPISFFEKVQLPHLPSYPLNACEIGDDDIILDPNKFTGLSNYGFYYPLEKSIRDNLSSIDVTYTSSLDIIENDVTDENGFEINEVDVEENIAETLKGIFIEKKLSECLNDGNVVDNIFKLDLKKNDSDENAVFSSIDYAVTSDGIGIIFNAYSPVIRTIFPNRYYVDSNDKILVNVDDNYSFADKTTLTADTNIGNFELKANLTTKSYQEFVDFEVDYDNGTIEFYNQLGLISGDFNITYNPLWVRGLSVADFPLKMDLWKEQYRIQDGGIYKLKYDMNNDRWVEDEFFEPTSKNPYTDNTDSQRIFYTFKTTVAPRDNIRKLVINEGTVNERILIEDSQFFVDYLANRITFYVSDLNDNDTITIHYTPNLTDNGLALAYRLKRGRYSGGVQQSDTDLNAQPQETDDYYIGMNYFTYRT